jgi:hypothetical protein
MNQQALNREVARVTGETVDRIARLGFSLLAEAARTGRSRPRQAPKRWRSCGRRYAPSEVATPPSPAA